MEVLAKSKLCDARLDSSLFAQSQKLNTSTFKINIKKPDACSDKELAAFADFVVQGGEVSSGGLIARIKSAAQIIMLTEQGILRGIAAIKNPNINYKSGIFNKAKSTFKEEDYTLELGWIFIHPDFRGRRLSHKLVEEAVKTTHGKQMFSTSRSDNLPMHSVLKRYGFKKTGIEYASIRGDYKLILFVLNSD